MALTPADYLASFRSDVDDPLEPGGGQTPDADCLWKDADVLRYLNDAQMIVARRALALRDVWDLPMVVNQALYTLPSWVVRPRTASVISDGRRVALVNGAENVCYERDYDLPIYIHDEISTGRVSALVFDERTGKVRAAPIPTDAETVRVFVFRLPKARVTADANCKFELSDERYEQALLLWMKKRAYEKEDADTLNKKSSEKYGLEFEIEITRLSSENTKRVRRAGSVRYGGL